MPKVAKVPSDVKTISIGNDDFHFTDGERQVTEAEAAQLLRYSELGGAKVEIVDAKETKGGK